MPQLYPDTTIGDRTGTLAYFDDEMSMCDPSRAAWAKLVCDNGDSLFFSVSPRRTNAGENLTRALHRALVKERSAKSLSYREKLFLLFDPNQPRDEMGRWSDDGGSVLPDSPIDAVIERLGSTDDASLLSGSATTSKRIGGNHVNSVIIVDLDDGSKAVFKPESGEAWNLDFANADINQAITNRDFSLAEREVMASEIDNLIGTDLVPETALRETFDIGDVEEGEDGESYDEDYIRELYDEYREKAQEDAMEAAGERMQEMYGEAREEHASDIESRAEEIAEIWNALIDENPQFEDVGPYGSRTAVAAHPTLPMGAEGSTPEPGFERASVGGVVDPIEVIDSARVDVSSSMSSTELERVREVLLGKLRDGATELGDVDADAARDHLSYDSFIEDHADTEARLIDENIQSFTAWRDDQGFPSDGGGGVRNTQAPHPSGGSLQRFVENLSEYGHLSWERGDYQRFAVFDYIVGSMDRHGGNVFFTGDTDENERPLGMDNGYSFPSDNYVVFRSKPVAEWLERHDGNWSDTASALRQKWADRIDATDWEKFVARHPRMSKWERSAFLERVETMKKALKTEKGLYELWSRDTQLMR